MAAPLFKVEVAFGNGPNDAAPSYTDISAYVRRRPPLTYSRGNNDEVEQLQAGEMSFVVDNRDGRFTVGSAASTSAWGETLKIKRPVRLSIHNGTSYVVAWTGIVDDWGTGWVNGVQSLTKVTCTDRVAPAGKIDMPAPVDAELLADSPSVYFPLQTGSGATRSRCVVTGDYVSRATATYSSDLSFGEDGGPCDTSMVLFSSNSVDPTWGCFLRGSSLSGLSAVSTAFTFELFVKVSRSAVSFFGNGLANFGGMVQLDLDAAGTLFAYATAGSDDYIGTFRPAIADGRLHHIAITGSISAGTATLKLYVDGVLVETATRSETNFGSTGVLDLGSGIGTGQAILDGRISHVAVYTSALSAARIAEHARALDGWAGDTTGERWNRLCGWAGLDSSDYTADTTTATMGFQPTAGRNLLDCLQDVVDVELGTAYCDAAGVLTLKASTVRYNASSVLTLAPQTVDSDLEFVANDAYLVNEAEITRSDGGPSTAVDTASVAEYGRYRLAKTLYLEDDDQALGLADWLAYRYSTPTARAGTLVINQTAKAAAVSLATMLGLDVDDLVTLSPLPATAPASSVQLFIDGLAGSIGDEWVIAFSTSPVGVLNDTFLIDTSQLNGSDVLAY